MTTVRNEVLTLIDSTEPDAVLIELGECVHTVILGEPAGYILKAKDAIRRALCPNMCQFLSDKRSMEVVDVAVAVGDQLLKAFSQWHPAVPAALIWKVAAVSAKVGLPSLLQCAGCPLTTEKKSG